MASSEFSLNVTRQRAGLLDLSAQAPGIDFPGAT